MRYTGTIPRFSVDPLDGSGVDDTTASLDKLKPFLSLLFPKAIAQSTIVSCTDELAASNAAPQIYASSSTNDGLDYAHNFYAQAIFYDCNARQQAQEDGVGRTEQEDDDSNMMLPVLTASNIGTLPEDLTRFVSWTDLPETQNVSGLLINKYLQDDGTRTKTRIDLKIDTGARSVWSVLYVERAGGDKSYIKAAFQESDEDTNGVFNEHRVSGRYWDDQDETIISIRASARKDKGVTIRMDECTGQALININAGCTTGTTWTYLDTDGNEMANESAATTAGLITESAPNGLPDAEAFFTGTQAEFFTPGFDVNHDPDNP